MLDDDPVNTQCDGLIDHIRLQGGVLAAVEYAQVNAERLGLLLNSGQVGLEKVTRRQVTDEGNLDVFRLVERSRHVRGKGHAGA